MSLPFNNEKNIKKYTCFVCGKEYSDFVDYKNHILECHEEGQDYVICPACSSPVRDLRLHCKVKHPNQKINFTGPSKALIFRDCNGKKVKTKKPKFREGYFLSQKNQKEMHYRSGWECQVYELLENLDTVLKYDAEPFKIQYLFEGQAHSYTPDISVYFADGHVEIWEVKPSNQTNLPKNHAKWLAADLLCKNRVWSFTVMTEKGIAKLKNKIKQQ